MEKQELFNSITRNLGLEIDKSSTISAINTINVLDKKGRHFILNIYTDRTTKGHGERKLFIKFKSQYIHENIDKCYKKLIEYFRWLQRQGYADSAEIKKYMCCPNGCWDHKDYWTPMNALEVVMDNKDCPWE